MLTARELTADFHECDGARWMIRIETHVCGQSKSWIALRPGAAGPAQITFQRLMQ
jgi:hypothetical protein